MSPLPLAFQVELPPLVHRVGLGRLQLILPAEDPLAPSYNIYEGGGG